jgi:hypothetical protein
MIIKWSLGTTVRYFSFRNHVTLFDKAVKYLLVFMAMGVLIAFD